MKEIQPLKVIVSRVVGIGIFFAVIAIIASIL
jgi:preprotein translocase subunit Sec61beta